MRKWVPSSLDGCALALLLLASCYKPDLTSGKFKCDLPGSVCPEGQSCVGGLCLDPRDVDQGAAPEPDLAVADLTASADLRPAADLAQGPDLSPVLDLTGFPCAQGGQQIAADVYACRGGFAANGASAQCVNGYRLCTDADDMRYGAMFMGKRGIENCDAIGGFYAILTDATIKANKDARCGTPNGGETAALAGCGTEDGVVSPGQTCKMLKSFFPCNITRDWSCTGSLSSATHKNLDGLGGVLCCKQ